MIANPCFHCWRDSQGLMNPAEVIVHIMKRDRMLKVLQFFRKAVRQPSEPTHGHSHSEVLSLNIACGDMVEVRQTSNDRLASSYTNCRTVSDLSAFWRVPVNLRQHRVVNFASKRIFDGCQIGAMTVSRQLYSVRKALFQIMHEVISAACVALADKPAGNKFRVRIEGNPCPAIARAFSLLLGRAILFLRINKIPDFITLDSLTRKVAKRFVLIIRTGAPKIAQQFHDGRTMDASYSLNRAEGIAFDQSSNHPLALFNAQLVHVSNMLARSSIINQEINYFFQRFSAALRAISFRLRAEREAARAFPPLTPPRRPSITAAGFLPSSVDSRTILAAI